MKQQLLEARAMPSRWTNRGNSLTVERTSNVDEPGGEAGAGIDLAEGDHEADESLAF